MFWVAEYGRIYRGDSNETLSDGDLQLADQDFEAILTLLDDPGESQFQQIFRYSKPRGRDVLTVQQYVGVIRTESGCQIEILPKISKNTDPARAREMLVKMLVELREAPFKQGSVADLRAHRMPLFELLLKQFLEHVGDIVRKGIARTYTDQQDNLIFLRGKLQLTENLKRNTADRSRLYCVFDEFEINRPINRLIKGALEIVSRISRDAENQQRCREFLFWFDRVPATSDARRDFRFVRRDRLVQHYQPAMPTCRLILEGLNPLTQQGERKALSLLFPMSLVFENYVAAKLRTLLPDWQIKTQPRSHALVDKHSNARIFWLQPDLEFVSGPHRVIGDTKWKLIDSNDRDNNYAISQADMYQLFAYAKKYLAKQERKHVILIYPRTDRFQSPLKPFWFRENDEVLHVLPFDLDNDELIMREDFILSVNRSNRQESLVA